MENNICQSCGMPLHKPEMYGTEKDGSFIKDYCIYCYKEGQFTSDVTMDEMIKICSKYVSSQGGNADAYAYDMRILYPSLKRWAQKEDTQKEYYKYINKSLDFINEHLDSDISLSTLAQVANISPYHFHRIFKSVVGENLAQYIKRLRLDYVARQLRSSSHSLEYLCEKSGYKSIQALSKAFKKQYDIPPSTYKKKPSEWSIKRANQLFPRICKISSKHIIYLKNISSDMSYNDIWQKLYSFGLFKNLIYENSESIGCCFNLSGNQIQTNFEFRPCISIQYPLMEDKTLIYNQLNGGIYAVFTHQGKYELLPELYKNIWFIWLKESNYEYRTDFIFEKYLNNPTSTDEKNLLTEVYIPITRK